jgi:hypothetical protein
MATYSRAFRRIDAAALEAAVGRLRVDTKTDEHKAAPELPGALPPLGRVATAAAMFARRGAYAAIAGAGGDYIPPAKGSRPTPLSGIAAASAGPPASPPAGVAP